MKHDTDAGCNKTKKSEFSLKRKWQNRKIKGEAAEEESGG